MTFLYNPPPDSFLVIPVNHDSPSFDVVRAIRMEVFVEEQGVPEELEMDESDRRALHFLALGNGGEGLGTVRLFADVDNPKLAYIGRVAVRREARRQGCGRMLMRQALDEARARRYHEVVLHAQTATIDFYRRLGFATYGDEFIEAGIPHRMMRLVL